MTDYLLPYQPSLASATGTRVDSACKHHHQCRVSTDDLLKMTLPKNNVLELQRNKYRYCVHKDELVVAFGRPWSSDESRKVANNAYPRVTSNLGMWDGTTPESQVCIKMITYMYHYARSIDEKEAIIEWFKDMRVQNHFIQDADNDLLYFKNGDANQLKDMTRSFIGLMYDFVPVGYAQTLGYAHSQQGDTMTTVMIGGLRTVLNGDFEINTDDEIQWYWDFEVNCFLTDGKRKRIGTSVEYDDNDGNAMHANVDPEKGWVFTGNNVRVLENGMITLEKDAKAREQRNDKIYGMDKGVRKMVPRIKPYWEDYENPRMYDKMRVFAVAQSCARPHEMVDIKICRQAM